VYIETSPDTVGVVVEMLGTRRGVMKHMVNTTTGTVRLEFLVPTRGLLGFRSHFLSATRGEGVIHTLFHGYLPQAGEIGQRSSGSLVSCETGLTTTFGLRNAEDRGTLFYGPGIPVYAGMVVGKHQRPGDLEMNVCKKKELTNMRAANADNEARLTTPRHMSLEEAIEYLGKDELLEVTPAAYRIRKQLLSAHERGRQNKAAKKAAVEAAS
jgi:GTP-binding protein